MKLKMTNQAEKLIKQGFKGNGCGSGKVSHLFCGMAQKFIGADLDKVWLIHDAEYSLPNEFKSDNHKMTSDLNAHYNINILAKIKDNKEGYNFKSRFSKFVHAILILYGDKSYYDD